MSDDIDRLCRATDQALNTSRDTLGPGSIRAVIIKARDGSRHLRLMLKADAERYAKAGLIEYPPP